MNPQPAGRGGALFALADQLEARVAKARGKVVWLAPSLPPSPGYGETGLARAFAGQLVPQDPTAEPAEKLLERIHAISEVQKGRSK